MQHQSLRRIVFCAVSASWLAGCAHGPRSPTAVDNYRSPMNATLGPGAGAVSITPVSNAAQRLDMVIKVRVQGARPNTTYIVQRAGEGGRDKSSDGVCQRALGEPPWSPSDPPVNFLFPSFRVPDPGGPEVSFPTDAKGNGSIDFEYLHPTLQAGIPFDMVVRIVDNVRGPNDRDAGLAPTSELRSACFTVTGK